MWAARARSQYEEVNKPTGVFLLRSSSNMIARFPSSWPLYNNCHAFHVLATFLPDLIHSNLVRVCFDCN